MVISLVDNVEYMKRCIFNLKERKMKTIINIGTNKKNITGVEIDKKFNDIQYDDIVHIVREKLGDMKGVIIQGWCDVTYTKSSKNN